MSAGDRPFEAMVEAALREDLRSRDVTSEAIVPADARGSGRIVAREPAVIAGLVASRLAFTRVDPELQFQARVEDGASVDGGAVVAEIDGRLRSILIAERTALNFLQRCSGIATHTRSLVELIADTGVRVLDTRKTAPGLRALDRLGVRAGGGVNHRFALDDMLLIKDNHVAAAGSLTVAVERALAGAGHSLKVEVEVDSLDQLEELLGLPRLPHVVLLDNFSPEEVRRAVTHVKGRLEVEVSGGITAATIRSYAEAGPDGISLGVLTHSVRAVDLALDLNES